MKKTHIHVKHILLKHLYELEDIIKRQPIDANNFSEIAKRYSICSSSRNGGDLSWQAKQRLEPVFLEAAEALKDGELSKPIRTSFGYHLIFKIAEK